MAFQRLPGRAVNLAHSNVGVMKGQFGFTKVRYKGLSKNAHYLFVSCALVNLVMARKQLLKLQAA